MSASAFTAFLATAFDCMTQNSVDGSIHFVCMDWRHLTEILAAGNAVYSELKNLCVWSKTNGGMGSLYRSAHELVLVFKVGAAAHINNVELGRSPWALPDQCLELSRRCKLRSKPRRSACHATEEPPMATINLIGLDISESVFQNQGTAEKSQFMRFGEAAGAAPQLTIWL